MTISRDEVIYAYRMILGREPENEAVIGHAMDATNLADLRRAFLGSAEFGQKYLGEVARELPVGRFFETPQIDIDIDCSPDQLQLMFDRIGKAWQAFGETEPHWSVLTNNVFRQDNLAENIEHFYNSGQIDIDLHLNFVTRAGVRPFFAKALDFGCGVGRLTLAMTPHAQQVVGVDISPPHLKLAAERAKEKGISNVTFDAIASVSDLDRHCGFDLVISRIVLQHNPPPVMAAIYAKLLAALVPGGIAIVQMPTFIQGQAFSAAQYLASEQPQMEMNALAQPLIYRIIEKADCRLIEIREDGSAGNMPALSHVFVVQKR